MYFRVQTVRALVSGHFDAIAFGFYKTISTSQLLMDGTAPYSELERIRISFRFNSRYVNVLFFLLH